MNAENIFIAVLGLELKNLHLEPLHQSFIVKGFY
jgi:hypothetical protein